MSTFTWSPAPGATENVIPRVKAAPFGDGYEQRVGDGINNQPRSWSLTFLGPTARTDAIAAFLKATDGVVSFDWTPPSGPAGKFVCRSWSRGVPALVVQSITATFTEVYGD
jgi:phage-related protein